MKHWLAIQEIVIRLKIDSVLAWLEGIALRMQKWGASR